MVQNISIIIYLKLIPNTALKHFYLTSVCVCLLDKKLTQTFHELHGHLCTGLQCSVFAAYKVFSLDEEPQACSSTCRDGFDSLSLVGHLCFILLYLGFC